MSTAGQTETGARGRPREVYDFVRGGQHWRFTSNSETISTNVGVFQAIFISRSTIELTPDLNRDSITITMDKGEDVPALFKYGSPAEVVSVTIYRVNEVFTDEGESSFPNPAEVIWAGRILSVRWTAAAAELNCEPSATSLKRIGLRRLWQRTCPHVLYDPRSCKVAKAPFVHQAVVDSISGNDIVVSSTGHADGWFSGGLLEWGNAVDSTFEQRMIRSHVGNTLTLTYAIPSLTPGQAVSITAGCKHTTDDCAGKFSNSDNYGGCPFIPEAHPFGTTIY